MKIRKNDDCARMKRDIPLGPIIEGDMIDIPFNDIVGVDSLIYSTVPVVG